jgi:Holliday junction resolvasome RuvABC ATP-dependent DNA helicase subunit
MHEPQANEVNDVSPSSLRHIVGQKAVVDSVSMAIDAAQMIHAVWTMQ